jgi:hypothetical protein
LESKSELSLELTNKTTVLRFQAGDDVFFTSDLLSYFVTQSSFRFVEPLPQISNGGDIFSVFLASFLALLEFDGKVINTFISCGESICRQKSKQESK